MLITATSLLAAAAVVPTGANVAANRRMLSQVPIGKYAPLTSVVDHANIDLDQKALEAAFGSSPYNFAAVKAAWTGAEANSKAIATCTITAAQSAAKDDPITYKGTDGATYTGKATTALTASSSAASFSFKTEVPTPPKTPSDSRVDEAVALQHCTTTGGSTSCTTIGSCSGTTYAGGRSLQGFSTKAKDLMYDNKLSNPPASCPAKKTGTTYANGCPYSSFVPYFDYYCGAGSTCAAKGDYANQFVLAAADQTASGLNNFNPTFAAGTTGNQETLRKDFLKKTSAYMSAWMYAIREFEDAIDDCSLGDLQANALSSGPVHAWDEGVAFYVGSQVTAKMFYDPVTGQEKMPDNKHLAYTLGNKRCANFKTCGRTGDLVSGEAYINFELWKLFGDGRDQILAGNCAGAVPVKNDIVELMTTPLIQGTLRYSWYCRNGIVCSAKAIGELAAFAGAVLPQVHACSPTAAATIALAANPSSYTCTTATQCTGSNNDFAAVKAAFEGCYSAMGQTGKMVGGLYNANKKEYEAGASPLLDASNAAPIITEKLGVAAIAGIAVGAGLAVLLLICMMYIICKEKAGTPLFTNLEKGKGAAA